MATTYAFEFHWDDGEDVSWTYLPTDDSARDYARILIRSFKGATHYRGSTLLTVKMVPGRLLPPSHFR
jgi:hypothetical protein